MPGGEGLLYAKTKYVFFGRSGYVVLRRGGVEWPAARHLRVPLTYLEYHWQSTSCRGRGLMPRGRGHERYADSNPGNGPYAGHRLPPGVSVHRSLCHVPGCSWRTNAVYLCFLALYNIVLLLPLYTPILL